MAKTAGKLTAEKTPKKSSAKKVTSAMTVDQACKVCLEKLQALDTEHQLQADIAWCLGSYEYDGNPAGLYEILQRSIEIFNAHKERKTKGVTAKMISELEAVLKNRA
jgi:hypothetical protein